MNRIWHVPNFTENCIIGGMGWHLGGFDFDSAVQNLAVMNPIAGLEVVSFERMFQATDIELLVPLVTHACLRRCLSGYYHYGKAKSRTYPLLDAIQGQKLSVACPPCGLDGIPTSHPACCSVEQGYDTYIGYTIHDFLFNRG